MKLSRTCSFGLVIGLLAAACGSDSYDPLPDPSTEGPAPWDPDHAYVPEVELASLSSEISHSLFPAPVGAHWVYEAQTDEGLERTEISVEAETRQVGGAVARVIRDTVQLDGEVIEDTWDWYGQDVDGTVWYLGEETYEYEGGTVVCDCGSWESGLSGALPGVIMLSAPQVGDVYRQEYLADEAEDIAEVISLDETVTVASGTFSGCLKTRDRSAIDLASDAFKYYCPGVGLVLEQEEGVEVELIEYSGL